MITVGKHEQNVNIRVSSDGSEAVSQLVYPDGRKETLAMMSGSRTGMQDPGSYKIEAINKNECSQSLAIIYTFSSCRPDVKVGCT